MKKLYFVLTFSLTLFCIRATAGDTLAYYPLTSDGVDQMGLNANMTLTNAPFLSGGVYCNGSAAGYTVLSPQINNFLFDDFYIGFDFMVEEYLTQPVIVGGTSYRWLGLYLNADSTISLYYNNSNFEVSTVTYETMQWYTGSITYDGTTARIYLNGELVTAWTTSLTYIATDTEIGTRNYATVGTLKGYLRNLIIINDHAAGKKELFNTTISFLPNPANDYLTISGSNQNSAINIYDITGRLVISTRNENKPIDLSGINTGVYFVRIENNGTLFTGKFVKK